MIGGGRPRVQVWNGRIRRILGNWMWMHDSIERVRVGEPQRMYKTMCRRCGEYDVIPAFWHDAKAKVTRPVCGRCAEQLEAWIAMQKVVLG